MTWQEFLSALVAAVFKGARDTKKANDADHAAAVERKADIDRRHVERRDLSNDKRPR